MKNKKSNAHNSESSEVPTRVKEFLTPLLGEIAQEKSGGIMYPPNPHHTYYWRPNNYRRQTTFKGNIGGIPNVSCGIVEKNEQNKLTFIKDYMGSTIIIGKDKIQAVYPQKFIFGNKQIFEISYRDKSEVKAFISGKSEEIREILDNSLFKIADELGLFLVDSINWSRREDWVREELKDYPREAVIHAKGLKKVYDEGVEFLDCDDFVGDDKEDKLDIIIDLLKIQNPLNYLKSLGSLSDVVACKNIVMLLSDQEKLDFSEWSFNKFGIYAES